MSTGALFIGAAAIALVLSGFGKSGGGDSTAPPAAGTPSAVTGGKVYELSDVSKCNKPGDLPPGATVNGKVKVALADDGTAYVYAKIKGKGDSPFGKIDVKNVEIDSGCLGYTLGAGGSIAFKTSPTGISSFKLNGKDFQLDSEERIPGNSPGENLYSSEDGKTIYGGPNNPRECVLKLTSEKPRQCKSKPEINYDLLVNGQKFVIEDWYRNMKNQITNEQRPSNQNSKGPVEEVSTLELIVPDDQTQQILNKVQTTLNLGL